MTAGLLLAQLGLDLSSPAQRWMPEPLTFANSLIASALPNSSPEPRIRNSPSRSQLEASSAASASQRPNAPVQQQQQLQAEDQSLALHPPEGWHALSRQLNPTAKGTEPQAIALLRLQDCTAGSSQQLPSAGTQVSS